MGARHQSAVVRQAVRARLRRNGQLGQDGSRPPAPGRRRRRYDTPLPRGLRAHHGAVVRGIHDASVVSSSNGSQDVLYALRREGADADSVFHTETDLGGADAVVLPGGFAHGDYLRTGAIARFSPVMDSVRALADGGAPVLGICNGFQILAE